MHRWIATVGVFLLLTLSGWAGTGHGPITLAWDAVTEDENNNPTTIAYYNVRWGTASGQHHSGTTAGSVTQFTVTGLDPQQLFYFVVTAVDVQGRESAVSNEVQGRPTLILHR